MRFSLDSSYNLRPQVSYQTEMGQLVDLITAPEDRVDLSKLISQVMLFSDIPPLSVPIPDDTQA